ncbi:MAG: glycosyltransferase family 2 protein [Geobacteraceae bacterium]|nr:glycosyltransferase family 2 protein [Geobacteraceae bacterium]
MQKLFEGVLEVVEDAKVYSSSEMRLAALTGSSLDLTLFIACYNEEDNITGTLDEVSKAMSGLDFSWEAIIIDDASTDSSVPIIKKYMANHPDYPLVLVTLAKNRGLAQNFIEASFLGNGRYYRLINGDNVEDSYQIESILKHIGESDILIPTHTQGSNRTLFRRLLSRFFTFLVNTISGYRIKYYNGCSVHLRYDVMRWHINSYGFDFQADLITRLLDQGRSYVEVATVCGERQHGTSNSLTARNIVSAAHFLFGLVLRRISKRNK